MPTLFEKMNLKEQREIVVLNAPASFEAELAHLKDVAVLRDVSKVAKVDFALAFRHELAMERNFVKAGGFLMAGCDPTGDGGVLPGFGDQRELELLVDAGFTPVEAIKIATLNGAIYEGKQVSIGSVSAGKNADLLVVDGDPSAKISDVENVKLVFKDGVAFDPAKLLAAARGRYGQY